MQTACLVVRNLEGLLILVQYILIAIEDLLLLNLLVEFLLLFLVEFLKLLVIRDDVLHVSDDLLGNKLLFPDCHINLICFIEQSNLVLYLLLFSHLRW